MFCCKTQNFKKTIGHLFYSKYSNLHHACPFAWENYQSRQLGYFSNVACQAALVSELWERRNKSGPSWSFRALSEENGKAIVQRGELKPSSFISHSWSGWVGHLYSTEFSSKGIWMGKNLKCLEDIHKSSVQYNLCLHVRKLRKTGNWSPDWSSTGYEPQKWKYFICLPAKVECL